MVGYVNGLRWLLKKICFLNTRKNNNLVREECQALILIEDKRNRTSEPTSELKKKRKRLEEDFVIVFNNKNVSYYKERAYLYSG